MRTGVKLSQDVKISGIFIVVVRRVVCETVCKRDNACSAARPGEPSSNEKRRSSDSIIV